MIIKTGARKTSSHDLGAMIDRADSSDSGERERADVALLQRIWGVDEQDARGYGARRV
jgi:hypothetical protein